MNTSLSTMVVTWATAWREAWANRRNFWTQITVMVLNDVVWVVFWILFFDRVGTLHGWDLDRLLVLFAILTTSAGIVLGLFNNVRRIGTMAATGELDAVLSLPTAPLAHLLCRRIETVNVGDLFFGIVLFAVFADPTPQRTAVFVFGVVCAVFIIGGFLVLLGSISFWASRNEAGELGFHAIVLFANYPADIFSGSTRLFLYAVVPAGFVSTAPTRLVEDFDPAWAAGVAGVAVLMAVAGWAAFTLGLRRYTSGAVWTAA